MPLFVPVAVEFWLLGMAIYERQRALLLQHHLDLVAAAISAQTSDEPTGSNIVPFRRAAKKRAVVVELR
jgi:hypothetical protein